MTYIILCSTIYDYGEDEMADAFWSEDLEEAQQIATDWIRETNMQEQSGQYSILKLVDGGLTEVVTAGDG